MITEFLFNLTGGVRVVGGEVMASDGHAHINESGEVVGLPEPEADVSLLVTREVALRLAEENPRDDVWYRQGDYYLQAVS